MNRRSWLRGLGIAGTVGVAGAAGCLDLERLGFERESAWRNPPLVEDRPDAVYVPAGTEEMGRYGTATDGDLGVALSYTFPHRFWLVRDDDVSAVEVGADDTHHLMVSVWDRETGTVLPAEPHVEVLRDGEAVASFTPWPMLSQRMGFHYGDNARLPEEGAHTARVQVAGIDAARRGAFAGRFEATRTVGIDFEYRRADVHALDFSTVDADRRGQRDALPLMDHAGHADDATHAADGGGGDGSPPSSRAPPVDALPGDHLGTERSGDADFAVVSLDADAVASGTEGEGSDGTYLAVSLRTPYNGVVIPGGSLSAVVERDGDANAEARLAESLHEDLGHHYGTTIEDLARGDAVTITVDRPPHVTRHDGYETAFFSFGDVTVTR